MVHAPPLECRLPPELCRAVREGRYRVRPEVLAEALLRAAVAVPGCPRPSTGRGARLTGRRRPLAP